MLQQPWFGRKGFGWSLGPISWQGRAPTGVYVVVALVLGTTLASRQSWLFATLYILLTALFCLVAFLTREG